MDYERLTIGEMASLNQVTTQTLRHYHRVGLLEPLQIDAGTGYRYYHIHQCATLDTIKYLKSIGIGLETIKDMISSPNIGELMNLLNSQMKIINEEIRVLESRKKSLNWMLGNVKKYQQRLRREPFCTEHQEERKIYVYKTKYNYFQKDIEAYELMIREFLDHLSAEKVLTPRIYNVGTIMRKKHFESGNFYSSEVFLILEEDSPADPENIQILPANNYLTVYSDSLKDEEKLARGLLEEVRRNGYQAAGDYICEVILDFSSLREKSRNFLYKLQVPVK